MKVPDPLVISWQGRDVRVRHDDPRLGPYTPSGARIRSAVELASNVAGLRLVLATALGDRCRVRVNHDGSVVGLWLSLFGVRDRADGPAADPAERWRHSEPPGTAFSRRCRGSSLSTEDDAEAMLDAALDASDAEA